MGHNDPFLAQFTNSSTLVTMNSTLFSGGCCRKLSTFVVSWRDAKHLVRGAAPRTARTARAQATRNMADEPVWVARDVKHLVRGAARVARAAATRSIEPFVGALEEKSWLVVAPLRLRASEGLHLGCVCVCG